MATFQNQQPDPTQTAAPPVDDFNKQINDLVGSPEQSSQQESGVLNSAPAQQAQPKEKAPKENIFKRAVKFVGSGVISYANDLGSIVGSQTESKAENESNLKEVQSTAALHQKLLRGEIGHDEFAKRIGQMGKFNIDSSADLPSTEQVLGDSLQAGLTVAPTFEVNALKATPWLARLVRGGVYGAAWGTATAMSENKGLGDTLIQAAETAPFGAGADLLIGGGSKLAGRIFSKAAPAAEKLASETEQKVMGSTFGQKVLQPIGNTLKELGNKFTAASSSLPDILNITSVYRRLSDSNLYGEAGQQIVDGFQKANTNARIQMGHVLSTMEDAGLFHASDEELWKNPDSLLNQLEGRAPSDANNPLFKTADDMRGDILNMAQEQIPNFKERGNYYPHQIPSMDILSNPESKVYQDVVQNMVLHNNFNSPEEAAQMLNSYVDFVKNEGRKGFGNDVLNYMVQNGQADTTEEARGMLLRFAQKGEGLTSKMGSLEDSRRADLPFYDPNPARALLTYGMNAFKRLNVIDQFGAKDEKLNQFIGEIAEDKGTTAGKQAVELIKNITGQIHTMPGEKRVSAFLRTLQILRISTAQILYLGQSVNEALVSDFGPWFKGIQAGFSDEGIRNGLLSGSTVEQTIRNHLQQMGYGQEFTDRYMKWIGFNRVQMMNRNIAANVGMLQGEHLLNKVVANPDDEISKAALGDLIGQDHLAETLANGKLSEDASMTAGQTMTNMTQFNYDPGSHPNFWATPSGKVIFQFKRFAFDQAKFVKDALITQLQRGDTKGFMRSIFHLAVTVPLTSEVLLDVKSLITQQKRPTAALDRYFQDVAHMGGFGILYDTFENALSGHLAESIVGPTIGEGVSLTQNAVQGLSKGVQKDDWQPLLKNLSKDFLYQTGTIGGILNRSVPWLQSKVKPKGQKSILEQIFSQGLVPTAQAKEVSPGAIFSSSFSKTPARQMPVLSRNGLIDENGNNLSHPEYSNVPNKPHIIAGVDISSYATDPNHEKAVTSIYNSMPDMQKASDIDAYISSKAKDSPVKGQFVLAAAKKYDVDPKLILAIVQQDSSFGTRGKAVRTKNAGNVGNTDSGATRKFGSWQKSVEAVAEVLSKHKS